MRTLGAPLLCGPTSGCHMTYRRPVELKAFIDERELKLTFYSLLAVLQVAQFISVETKSQRIQAGTTPKHLDSNS